VIHNFLDLGISGNESVKPLSTSETKVLSQAMSVLPTTQLWIDISCICDGGPLRKTLRQRISVKGTSCCQRGSIFDYVLKNSISRRHRYYRLLPVLRLALAALGLLAWFKAPDFGPREPISRQIW
jgi:hypothetical protein